MGLVNDLKTTILGDGDEITYRYHCRDCESPFESVESSVTAVTCPQCGAGDSRTIDKL